MREAWISRCVSAIRNALDSLNEPHEIIVVDDASTDAAALIARQQGAQVIRVEHRQITATRNAGARRDHGDIFFFVDSDSSVQPPFPSAPVRRSAFLEFLPFWARSKPQNP